MTASTTVLLPSQQPPPSVFHGIVIQPHIPYIYFCQIPLGFILLIFDLPIPYWHEPIKNKNKNGIFEVVFGFQKWTSIVELWRLSITGCHFFPCFWFPYWNEEPETKTKTPFLFLFLTSLLVRPDGIKYAFQNWQRYRTYVSPRQQTSTKIIGYFFILVHNLFPVYYNITILISKLQLSFTKNTKKMNLNLVNVKFSFKT